MIALALPSKGRLREQCLGFFADCGLPVAHDAGDRGYQAALRDVPGLTVVFLRPEEIATRLRAGEVHLGVTGEDLLREIGGAGNAHILDRLGFGHARLVVAVPAAWLDVRTMRDLEDVSHAFRQKHGRSMRVATKYVRLTRRFFARHGVSEYAIVRSLGATEGAPMTGDAELIVDITSSGATLAANHLKILDDGVILASEACLIGAFGGPAWTPEATAVVLQLTSMMEARRQARATYHLAASVPPSAWGAVEAALGCLGCQVLDHVSAGDAIRITTRCGRASLFAAVAALREAGAGPVSATAPDYVFAGTPRAYALFARHLKGED